MRAHRPNRPTGKPLLTKPALQRQPEFTPQPRPKKKKPKNSMKGRAVLAWSAALTAAVLLAPYVYKAGAIIYTLATLISDGAEQDRQKTAAQAKLAFNNIDWVDRHFTHTLTVLMNSEDVIYGILPQIYDNSERDDKTLTSLMRVREAMLAAPKEGTDKKLLLMRELRGHLGTIDFDFQFMKLDARKRDQIEIVKARLLTPLNNLRDVYRSSTPCWDRDKGEAYICAFRQNP